MPNGALRTAATATITAAASTGGPTDDWPTNPAGPRWTIDLGGATLAKPVTLALPYDPTALPAGSDPSEVILAYQDVKAGSWVPVPATIDPAAHTVSASVSHLSTWSLFTINWDYWLGFIAKAASGNLTDLLGAVGTLTTKCAEKSTGFVVDNSATNGMIKGCVQKVANGKATIGVTNMRAISFALSGGAIGSTWPILDAGDTVTFTAGGTKLAQPLVAGASLSPMVLGYQLTDLTLRLLPGSDVFTRAGSYGKVLKAIVEAEGKTWTSAKILEKLKQSPPDVAGAAEEAFKLMTDQSFLSVFVTAAIAAGRQYGVPILTELTPARLSQVMLAANLAVLDATVLSWDVQYFLAGYGEVKVTWTVAPAAPTKVRLVADCQSMEPADHRGCWITDFWQGSTLSLKLSWSEASAVEGFRIYETPLGGGNCSMSPIGPTTLVAKVGSGARSWVGTLRWTDINPNKQQGVRYSIAAFNAAGASKQTPAQARWSTQTWWEEPLDWGGACSGATP